MILYGVLAEQSIADLFVAGILPGVISALLFSLYIYIICRVRPDYGPQGKKFTFGQKRTFVEKHVGGSVSVRGGHRRIVWRGFHPHGSWGGRSRHSALDWSVHGEAEFSENRQALLEASRISAMVFIILGAVLFGYFLTASQVTSKLANYVVSLSVPPVVILISILMVFLFRVSLCLGSGLFS